MTDVQRVLPWDEPLSMPQPGNPVLAEQHRQRALEHRAALRDAEAVEEFERAVQADPASLPVRLDYGFLLLESRVERSDRTALLMFRTARLLDPGSEEAACGEALARASMGDVEGSLVPLLRFVEDPELAQDPGRRSAVHRALGDLFHGANDTAAAEVHYRQAIELEPDLARRASVRCALASLWFETGLPDEAEAGVRRAIEEDPESLPAHYLLLRLLERKGPGEERDRERRIHEILAELRSLSSKTRKSTDARRIELRRELLEVFPYPRAGRRLIRELLAVQEYSEAAREVFAEKGDKGFDAELLYLLARAMAGSGDLEAARKAVDALRTLNPAVPGSVIRDVLDEWRRAFPGADPAACERLYAEWTRPS